jgi:hypothetical protein
MQEKKLRAKKNNKRINEKHLNLTYLIIKPKQTVGNFFLIINTFHLKTFRKQRWF